MDVARRCSRWLIITIIIISIVILYRTKCVQNINIVAARGGRRAAGVRMAGRGQGEFFIIGVIIGVGKI